MNRLSTTTRARGNPEGFVKAIRNIGDRNPRCAKTFTQETNFTLISSLIMIIYGGEHAALNPPQQD
jgi:hypothetical protein